VSLRIETDSARVSQGREELESVKEEVRRSEERVARHTQQMDAADAQISQARTRIENWKVEVFDVLRAQAGLRNEILNLERNRHNASTRRARLRAELAEIADKMQRLAAHESDLSKQRDMVVGRLADHRALLARNEQALRELHQEQQRTEEALRQQRHEEVAAASRRDVLRDLEMRAEGVDKGVRWVLANKKSADASEPDPGGDRPRLAGVRGMVADLLHVDLEHAAAIEAALGERAQHVVVDTTEASVTALDLLRQAQAGRAGVLPLDQILCHSAAPVPSIQHPGVLGAAADLVRNESSLQPLVRYLLDRTLVVRDLNTALALACDGCRAVRLVTLQGEVLEPGGAIIGGEAPARGGLISRKSELDLLDAQLKRIAEARGRLEWQQQSVAGRLDHSRAENEALRDMIEQGNLSRLHTENAIAQHARDRQALAEQQEVVRMETDDLDESLRSYAGQETRTRAELDEAVSKERALKVRVDAAQKDLEALEQRATQLRTELADYQAAHAQQRERQAGLEATLADLEASLADLVARLDLARRQMRTYRLKREEAQREIRRKEADLHQLRVDRGQAEKRVAALREERAALHARHADQQGRLKTLRDQQRGRYERLQELRIAESEHRMRLENLAEKMQQDFDVAIADLAAEQTEQEERNWGEAATRAADLQKKVNAMRGTVDTETIQKEEELEFLLAQQVKHRDDLVAAEAKLREVIRRLNRISRKRFAQTFEEIRHNFQEIFRKMFGGGHADLRLEEGEDDVLEAGIDIVACPPGKREQKISLLSGGEKTMTSIALLFAIFKSKPSPFCILDEIDAALDESNIDRFIAMVNDFLKDSQFIIITHSKRTMGIADVLYGITMQEAGVSKKVAVKLENVQRAVTPGTDEPEQSAAGRIEDVTERAA